MQVSISSHKRMFFALRPDDLIRQKCVSIIQKINNNENCRFVAVANLHVTLVFLGNILEEQVHALRKEAAMIAMPQLTICFNHLSFWKKPGILCLNATETAAEIMQMVSDLTSSAEKLNIVVDKRAYQPHITLARKVTGPKALEFEPINWVASSFCLVESCPKSDKSDYRIIEEWPCRQSATT